METLVIGDVEIPMGEEHGAMRFEVHEDQSERVVVEFDETFADGEEMRVIKLRDKGDFVKAAQFVADHAEDGDRIDTSANSVDAKMVALVAKSIVGDDHKTFATLAMATQMAAMASDISDENVKVVMEQVRAILRRGEAKRKRRKFDA